MKQFVIALSFFFASFLTCWGQVTVTQQNVDLYVDGKFAGTWYDAKSNNILKLM